MAEFPKPAAWKSYLVGLAIVAAALVVRLALDPYLGNLLPYVTFFVAVTVVAWYEELGPTLLAIIAGACVSNYFFIPPRHSFAIDGIGNQVGFATYFLVTMPIAFLAHRQKRDAAARMKAEERLSRQEASRESEEQFRTFANAIPQLCWMANPDGFIFWYNQRWYEYTGTTPEQMEGWGWQSVHNPETLPKVLEQWKGSIATGEPFDMVFPLRGADGVFRPFLTRVMPVKDAEGKVVRWFGTNTDITAQKSAEEELREREVLLRTVTESSRVGLVMLSADRHYLYANSAYAEVLGLSTTEIVGKRVPDVMGHVYDQISPRLDRAFAGERVNYELKVPVRQGTGDEGRDRFYAITYEPLPSDGEGSRVIVVVVDTTERRQAEDALHKSEERYRNLFNSMDEGFCVIEMIFDSQGKPADYRFLEVNSAFERQTGLHEAVGKRMRELAPDHDAHWFEIYGRIALTGEPAHFVNEAKALNRYYNVHAYRVGEPEMRRVAIVFDDFSEFKRAEEALRSSEQRWATTLQSIGDAVISTCAEGKIEFMNDVAQKLTGWTLPEAKGRDLTAVFDIVQEVTRIKPENPVAKVIRLGKVIGLANHTVLIHRHGTEIPIEDSAAPIRNPKGQMEGVVLVFHDVLEQRKVEATLRNSDRLATTGKLAATIAHEIHNPLDAVGNLLFLIGQDAKDNAIQQYVAMASEELARVTQMTRQMLVFQREAAKPVPVKIREILESVTALFERKISSAGIRLERRIDFDGHILVQPGELRQIFANLVGNAIEAMGTRRGRITLRAYESQDRRRSRPGLRVLVADDGPGIPEHVRGKIFEPFFTTKGESGTGLGLWIASDILRKYDGTMRLRSCTQPDRSGTCFSIFLPFENSPDSPVRS